MGHPRGDISCGKWNSPGSPPAAPAPTLLAQQVQKKEIIFPIFCRIKSPREVDGGSFSHMVLPEPITGQETGHPDWSGLGLVLHPRGQQWGRHLGESSIRKLWELSMVPKGKAGASTRRTVEKLLCMLDIHKIKQTKPATTTRAK